MDRAGQIQAAISRLPTPVFLARENDGSRVPVIDLYTSHRRVAGLRDAAAKSLSREGVEAECRVVVRPTATLERKRSIESFSRTFGSGRIVYDPTGVAARSLALVACARMLRKQLGERISGVYFEADRRTVFVIVDRKRFVQDPERNLRQRVETMGEIGGVVTEWRNTDPGSFEVAICIGYEAPAGTGLIAIDRASASLLVRHRIAARLRKPGVISTIASLLSFGAAAPALAADVSPVPPPAPSHWHSGSSSGPAVAAPNLGIILNGGILNGDGFSNHGWGSAGVKAAVPLGDKFGAQFDAAFGADSYYGAGGHLFWRDPAKGLLGIFASYETMNTGNLTRYGAEWQAYFNNLTLKGKVGGQNGTFVNGAFVALDLTFYATPNFALSIGGELSNRSIARASIEWQPATSGLHAMSVYADGEIGQNGYSRVLAGVKFHFGTNGASLIDRDRKYDPDSALSNPSGLAPGPGYTAPTPP